MKEIRVLKCEGHALSQDVIGCVSTLKLADIWAYAEVLEYAEWRTIAIVSELSPAIEILRAEGFEVIDESNSARFAN